MEPGSKLGQYEIQVRIGAGGMGEVYKAHDPRLDRDVAIKILSGSFAADAERLRRFEQEARVVGALNHPNIVAIFELGTHEGAPYIVSELLQGETLRQCIDDGIPMRKAIEYAQQIAYGLSAAHDKAIVHRDLKPENIIITRDGRAKILDFGLAKLTQPDAVSASVVNTVNTMDAVKKESLTSPGQVMGTVGYMSPEQVRGLPADFRSDIFSFGAILFEMFSGVRAFKHDSAVETMTAILKEDPADLTSLGKQVPPGLDRIIRHCLEKKPEERFQSARDIGFDLAALSNISTTTGQKALTVGPSRAWTVPAIAVAAIILAGVTGWFAGRGRNASEPPNYHQLTFRRGTIVSAKFAPDGHTVVYRAAWEGKPFSLYTSRTDAPGERELGIDGDVLGISKGGELAILIRARARSGYARRGVLARMPLAGGAPREILEDVQDAAWSPDGNQLAVVRYMEDSNSYQLEFPIGHMLYKTGGWISHPRVSPDGKKIAFIDHQLASGDDQGQPAIVDLAGNVKKLAQIYTSSQGVVWSPDGKEIWFSGTSEGSDKAIYAVSESGKLRTLARAPGDLLIQDILPDGLALAIRNDNRREIRGRGPADQAEHDLSWLDWGNPRGITPDGKTYLFEEEGNGGGPNYSVFLRSTDGSPAVKLTDFGVAGAISADAKYALIVSNKSPQQLYLVPTGAGEPEQLFHDKRDFFGARFLPDGYTILYAAGESGQPFRRYRMDLRKRKEIAISPPNFIAVAGPSLDGSTFVGCLRQHCYLWPTDGSWADKDPATATPIPGGLGTDYFAFGMAADGKAIYVGRRNEFLPRKVYRYELATGAATPFGSFGPPDLTGVPTVNPPILSSDGKSYVYYYPRWMSQLYVLSGLK